MTFADTALDPIVIDVTPRGGALGVATRWQPYPTPEDEPGWSVRLTTRTGQLVADLPLASVDQVRHRLNRPRTARLFFAKSDPAAVAVQPGLEVQVWDGDRLLFFGPITAVSAQSSRGPVRVDAADPLYYLERRYFGTAERLNVFTNGGFEGGLSPWTAQNVTATHTTTGPVLRGNGVARLSGRTSPDAFIRQQTAFHTTFPPGDYFEVKAWCYIEDFGAPALDERGVMLMRLGPGATVEDIAIAPITEDTPRGQWVPLTTGMLVPPNQTWTLEMRLYGVGGVIRWDEARSVRMESTSGDLAGNDRATLIRRIVHYAQHGRGKSPVNIGISAPATGVFVPPLVAWQHADHQPIMDVLRYEFIDPSDGVDISIEVTPTTRTFRTHFPLKGADRTASVVLRTEGPNTNCEDFVYDTDLFRSAQDIVVLGDEFGASREEGGAFDRNALPGGLILEDVIAAPPGTPIRQLDLLAASELDARRQPIRTIEALVTDRTLWGLLETGDRVSVDFTDGWVNLSGAWRINEITFTPEAETMLLTMERWEG